jgi:hypothetical protein
MKNLFTLLGSALIFYAAYSYRQCKIDAACVCLLTVVLLDKEALIGEEVHRTIFPSPQVR